MTSGLETEKLILVSALQNLSLTYLDTYPLTYSPRTQEAYW